MGIHMKSDKQIARDIALRKELAGINRGLSADGVILLVYSHTDDTKLLTQYNAGDVPAMPDVIASYAEMIARVAYDVGKEEAKSEFNKTMATNLDDAKTVT